MSLKQLSIVPCIPQHAGNHCFLKRFHFLIFVAFLIRKCSFPCVCAGKTKILTVEEQGKEQQVYKEPAIYITLQDQALQEVEAFSY